LIVPSLIAASNPTPPARTTQHGRFGRGVLSKINTATMHCETETIERRSGGESRPELC
jgi:hypothetical protein